MKCSYLLFSSINCLGEILNCNRERVFCILFCFFFFFFVRCVPKYVQIHCVTNINSNWIEKKKIIVYSVNRATHTDYRIVFNLKLSKFFCCWNLEKIHCILSFLNWNWVVLVLLFFFLIWSNISEDVPVFDSFLFICKYYGELFCMNWKENRNVNADLSLTWLTKAMKSK